MKRVLKTAGAVVALATAFAAGDAWQSWRADQALKAHPCMVRQWQPDDRAFSTTDADPRDCLSLGPKTTVTGIWSDYAYLSGTFAPEGTRNLPAALDLALLADQRVQIQWMAGLPLPPKYFSRRRYRLTVKGRAGRYDGVVLDGTNDVLVVDEIVSVTLLPDRPGEAAPVPPTKGDRE